MSKQTRNTFRTNLPVLLTSFIGRERELAEVTDSLASTRLLTLSGTGCCGKTRLALQLAKDTVDAFPVNPSIKIVLGQRQNDLASEAYVFA